MVKRVRSDSGYLYWRWSPRDCKLPEFNPKKFLKFMRNKSLAFIGDSVSRNHVQFLLCILSKNYLRWSYNTGSILGSGLEQGKINIWG
ncbi:hypothetical protein VIGAN_06090800 [Vigna angularis var. angularis]|uniref:Trichome birefringence-like C-terminal domain-containing protein n=1 Tax=Vigna angularis var. angularis TaxID=157739 RepID=A0A0S3SAK9_PHAAN|nr:hypothetical protein VIGAN_06090800 [Vigna angularis var. angularis]